MPKIKCLILHKKVFLIMQIKFFSLFILYGKGGRRRRGCIVIGGGKFSSRNRSGGYRVGVGQVLGGGERLRRCRD